MAESKRIDWSLDLDPENPMMLDDRVIPIFGTEVRNRMTEKERREVRIICKPRKYLRSCTDSNAH